MKKINKSLFNDKKSKLTGAAAAGAAAAAAGVAAMVGDKDTDAEGHSGKESASDSQLDMAQDLQDAAVSAAGDMADKVANAEQNVVDEGLLADETASTNTEAVVDDDVVIIDNAGDIVIEEAIVVEPAAAGHAGPVVAEPVTVEPVANEPVSVESVVTEPVITEPIAQNEPVREEPVRQTVDTAPDNDVAIVVDDPMMAPEPVDDSGDFYDPDVNVVNYMADADMPDDMGGSGIGEMMGELADGLMSGIKDLGDSISGIFTRDNFSDELMNPGEGTGLDEDANADYINDANVDAFQ